MLFRTHKQVHMKKQDMSFHSLDVLYAWLLYFLEWVDEINIILLSLLFHLWFIISRLCPGTLRQVFPLTVQSGGNNHTLQCKCSSSPFFFYWTTLSKLCAVCSLTASVWCHQTRQQKQALWPPEADSWPAFSTLCSPRRTLKEVGTWLSPSAPSPSSPAIRQLHCTKLKWGWHSWEDHWWW